MNLRRLCEHTARDWHRWPLTKLFWSSGTFYPRGSWQDHIELMRLLSRKLISVAQLAVPFSKAEPTARAKLKGGAEHARLKMTAAEWVRANGDVPRIEQQYHGLFADVLAPKLRWVIECGDTNPRYALEALGGGSFSRFVLLPFTTKQKATAVIFAPEKPALLQKTYARRQLLQAESVGRHFEGD